MAPIHHQLFNLCFPLGYPEMGCRRLGRPVEGGSMEDGRSRAGPGESLKWKILKN